MFQHTQKFMQMTLQSYTKGTIHLVRRQNFYKKTIFFFGKFCLRTKCMIPNN